MRWLHSFYTLACVRRKVSIYTSQRSCDSVLRDLAWNVLAAWVRRGQLCRRAITSLACALISRPDHLETTVVSSTSTSTSSITSVLSYSSSRKDTECPSEFLPAKIPEMSEWSFSDGRPEPRTFLIQTLLTATTTPMRTIDDSKHLHKFSASFVPASPCLRRRGAGMCQA